MQSAHADHVTFTVDHLLGNHIGCMCGSIAYRIDPPDNFSADVQLKATCKVYLCKACAVIHVGYQIPTDPVVNNETFDDIVNRIYQDLGDIL